jgi:predicted RNA-binding protein with PIN domain
MSRLIIVDGYNIVLRSPHLRPGPDRTLREARAKLINLLAWAMGGGEARFVVVFDGAEDAGARDGREGREDRIVVRYSRPPEKADDLIRQLVEKYAGGDERVTVVTSDLEVARHARAMGADVSLADLFLASALGPEPGATPEKPVALTKKEVEEWAELFTRRPRESDNADDDGTVH